MTSEKIFSSLYDNMRDCHTTHHQLLTSMQEQCNQARNIEDLQRLGSIIYVFCQELHDHHTAEDEYMFPVIARKTDISHLESQHELLSQTLIELENVARYIDDLENLDENISDIIAEVTLLVNEVFTLVTEHERAEEEVIAPDNMKRLFTEIEMQKLQFHKS